MGVHMTYYTWGSFHLVCYSFIYKYDIDYVLGPVSIYDQTPYRDRIAVKFDRHLGSAADDLPVKCQMSKSKPESRGFEILR